METIKKEKKAEYETIGQLMKSLIERGWLPRGDKEIVRAVYDVRHKMIGLYEDDGKEYFELVYKKSLRELVSTDSGLWQFVCENMLIDKKWFYGDEYCIAEHCEYTPKYYKFRLIESSLKDESELEDFLIQNIKLEGLSEK